MRTDMPREMAASLAGLHVALSYRAIASTFNALEATDIEAHLLKCPIAMDIRLDSAVNPKEQRTEELWSGDPKLIVLPIPFEMV